MGNIFCWSCGQQVSDQAYVCPRCGANLKANPNQVQNNWQQPVQPSGGGSKGLLYAIIGFLVALVAAGLAFFLFSQSSEKDKEVAEIRQQQEVLEQKNEQLQKEVEEAKAEKKEESKQEAAEQPAAPAVSAGNPVSGMAFIGSIGGDNGAYLEMPSGSRMGSYRFINFTRNTKFTSYNPSTGALVISAYELGTGKYIGKFVGTLKKLKYGYKYTGTFTNYKGGKVNFNLEDLND